LDRSLYPPFARPAGHNECMEDYHRPLDSYEEYIARKREREQPTLVMTKVAAPEPAEPKRRALPVLWRVAASVPVVVSWLVTLAAPPIAVAWGAVCLGIMGWIWRPYNRPRPKLQSEGRALMPVPMPKRGGYQPVAHGPAPTRPPARTGPPAPVGPPRLRPERKAPVRKTTVRPASRGATVSTSPTRAHAARGLYDREHGAV